jgi:peptidoglycan/LPS O-acetylase OafA/YrhL
LFVIEWLASAEIIVSGDWPRWSLPAIWFAVQPAWRISALAFLGGMLCWRYRAHLKWNGRVALLAAAVLLAGICGQQWRLVMPLALPYLVLYLAARLPFQKMERWGDYSYGIYIFSFPIQQLLYFHGLHRLGFAAYLAASLILSLAAGVLSWWLVEKPALRLGRKFGAWDILCPLRGANRRTPVPVAAQLSLSLDACEQVSTPRGVL